MPRWIASWPGRRDLTRRQDRPAVPDRPQSAAQAQAASGRHHDQPGQLPGDCGPAVLSCCLADVAFRWRPALRRSVTELCY